MGTRELLERADENLVEAWRRMMALGPHAIERRDAGVLLVASGVPAPVFNPAFVLAPVDDPAAAVGLTVAHYEELGLPFVLLFRDAVAPGLADVAAARGLREHWQPPLMVRHGLDDLQPPEVTITAVDAETIDAFAHVLGHGFGVPMDMTTSLIHPGLLDVDGFTGFVAWIDGEPVSSSALIRTDGMAGIYDVATVPSHRGRGLGGAVTVAAAIAGRECGADVAVLQASAAGRPLYADLGFVDMGSYRQFQPA